MKYLLVGLFSCTFSILYGLYKERKKNKSGKSVRMGKIIVRDITTPKPKPLPAPQKRVNKTVTVKIEKDGHIS
jgi:hypothetical protein